MNGHLCRVSPVRQLEIARNGGASAVLVGGVDGAAPLLLAKDWHVVHFLLTGSAWGGEPPLAETILGGEDFGAELGYGRCRYLAPERVERVARALEGVASETLRARFEPAQLARADIYPMSGAPLTRDELEEYFPDVFAKLDRLADYYAEAAEAGQGMLLALL